MYVSFERASLFVSTHSVKTQTYPNRKMDDKTSFIDSWLEGVSASASAATSAQTEQSDSDGRPKRSPHLRQQPQPQPQKQQQQQPRRMPCPKFFFNMQASEETDKRVLRSHRRKGQPQPPPPTDGSGDESSRPRKRRKPTKQRASFRIPESTQAHSEVSYFTSQSHPSTRTQRIQLKAAKPAVILSPIDNREEKPEGVRKLMSQVMDSIEDAVPASLR